MHVLVCFLNIVPWKEKSVKLVSSIHAIFAKFAKIYCVTDETCHLVFFDWELLFSKRQFCKKSISFTVHFFTDMKNVNLCHDQCWASWLAGHPIVHALNMIHVKLCMMLGLIELYSFIPFSMTMILNSRSQQCQTVLTENFVFSG